MTDRKPCSLWPLMIATLLGLPVAMFAYFIGARHQLNETKANGETIVSALETFRSHHEHYPESLDELTPTYVADIPPAHWGEALWIYRPEDGGFNLLVNEDGRTGDGNSHWLQYDTVSRKWEMGD